MFCIRLTFTPEGIILINTYKWRVHMTKLRSIAVLLSLLFLLAISSFAFGGDTYVNGYYRSNGTYVAPHYRSSPNQFKYDNYSSKGNTNPYTGTLGTQRNEFSTPPSYNKSYGGGSLYGNSGSNLYGNSGSNLYGNSGSNLYGY